MLSFMQKFWQDESGQDLIEYTLLMAFVALASRHCSSAPATVSAGSGETPAASWSPRTRQPVNPPRAFRLRPMTVGTAGCTPCRRGPEKGKVGPIRLTSTAIDGVNGPSGPGARFIFGNLTFCKSGQQQ